MIENETLMIEICEQESNRTKSNYYALRNHALKHPERVMNISSGDVTDLNFVNSDCFLLDI